jgi:sugar phosphate permease
VKSTQIHRAWYVAGVTFAVLITAAAFRSTMGVLLQPFEEEFGWTRSTTSLAASLNLLIYGLTAPFAATLLEKYPLRKVVAAALLFVSVGSGLTTIMSESWHLMILWGVLVSVGCGALALVFGATVANRWFVKRRGLVTGVFSAAYATGQLIFLPLFGYFIEHQGWRFASITISLLAAWIILPVMIYLRDRPSDLGLRPYGADSEFIEKSVPSQTKLNSVAVLKLALRRPAFWALAGTFFVCGWSTNGLIGTHFIPATHDHGMPLNTATSLLAIVGIFDFIGTIASGWLTDKVSSVWLLFAYYGLRGLALFTVPLVLGPTVEPPLLFFIVFYGLDWIATVPPTVQLCREHFGLQRSSIVYGWVFTSHMVGAAVASAYAGIIREHSGSYTIAWITAAVLCIVAAVGVLTMRKMPATADL